MMETPMVSEYPDFTISDKDLKAIKKWVVGKKYKLLLTVKQLRKSQEGDTITAGFKILGVKSDQEREKVNELNKKYS